MSAPWRKKGKDIKSVTHSDKNDQLTLSMDLLVLRMADIAADIEEQLSTPTDQQHPLPTQPANH